MRSMNKAASKIKSEALAEQFAQILMFVQEAYQEGGTAHKVKSGFWQRMLKLGRSIFQAWLDLFGDCDAGDRIVLEDGREVRRLAEGDRIRQPFDMRRPIGGEVPPVGSRDLGTAQALPCRDERRIEY